MAKIPAEIKGSGIQLTKDSFDREFLELNIDERLEYKLKKLQERLNNVEVSTNTCNFCSKKAFLGDNSYICELQYSRGKVNTVIDKTLNSHWLIIISENLYPMFHPFSYYLKKAQINGTQLIFWEFPFHAALWHTISPELMEINLKAYVESMKLEPYKNYNYSAIFKNQGIEAGASISHAHSQAIFFDKDTNGRLPKFISRLHEKMRKDSCAICEEIKNIEDKKMVINETNSFLEYCPQAPYPFTIRITSKECCKKNLLDVEDNLGELAKLLKDGTCRLGYTLGDTIPYNIVYHQAPCDKDNCQNWHFFVDIIPRGIFEYAGFEFNTWGRLSINNDDAFKYLTRESIDTYILYPIAQRTNKT